MSYQLPPVSQLSSLTQSEQDELITHLFEPSSTIFTYLRPYLSTSYSSYLDFIETSRTAFLKLSKDKTRDELIQDERISEIIACHPRLGVPKTVKLSEHSANEQKSLQSDDSTIQKFITLNENYEKVYPGLRFVLFVNGRPRDQVVKIFEERIERKDYKAEVDEALNAMCDIAIDRYKKMINENKL